MSVRGWFPDPSGRFSQRWYDGHRWSDQVVAANGTTIDDPLPETDKPHPPPMPTQVVPPSAPPPAAAPPLAPHPVGALPPVAARPGPPPGGALPSYPSHPGGQGAHLRPGATLGVGLFGLLVAALSLFGVPWASHVNFFDISEGARNASGDGELLVRIYAAAGGFILFVIALTAVVLAGIPVPARASGAAVMRVTATFVCGLAAVLHTVTVVRIFRGPASPDIGAWLGTVGYFVAIVGLVVGHYRRPPQGPVPRP